jgi:hypothetical protein
MESRRSTVCQAANNEPLVRITVPQEQVKKKYSGINSTIYIRNCSYKNRYRKVSSEAVHITNCY